MRSRFLILGLVLAALALAGLGLVLSLGRALRSRVRTPGFSNFERSMVR